MDRHCIGPSTSDHRQSNAVFLLFSLLLQIDHHVRQQKNLRIVGYYQCNELFEDADLSGPGKRFADKIESLYSNSVAAVVSDYSPCVLLCQFVLPLVYLSTPTPTLPHLQLDAKALQHMLEGRGSKPLVSLFFKDGPRQWARAAIAKGEDSAAVSAAPRNSFICPLAGVEGLIQQYTQEGRHYKLVDFEDHLEDITR